jgi:uncharacterized ferritin-like protein (DUF455 family)
MPSNNSAHSTLEMSEWAFSILSADTLDKKLFSPNKLTDHSPGPARSFDSPVRPVGMGFVAHDKKKHRMPKVHEFSQQDKVAECLHRFAGHELLAVEIMAYALIAFPDAPKHFRRAVANTLQEEQGHVRIYIKRLLELGVAFGDLPLFKHFWSHVPYLTSPIKYVSVMNLTLEMANLDFAPFYRDAFISHGDADSAALMQKILEDEISHVATGYHWLKKLKPKKTSEWDAFTKSLSAFCTPKAAKGFVFQEEPRIQAGISPDWIANLKSL